MCNLMLLLLFLLTVVFFTGTYAAPLIENRYFGGIISPPVSNNRNNADANRQSLLFDDHDDVGLQVARWSYDDIGSWPGQCQTGRRQSPINIQYSNTVQYPYPNFSPINFDNYQTANISNNGHTVQINFPNARNILLSGGGLPYSYQIENIHFHWAAEHTINAIRFPLEIHLVFFNNIYRNITEASQNNGVVVLATLVEACPTCTPDSIATVANQVRQVVQADSGPIPLINRIRLRDFLPFDIFSIYRYQGSLTTPNCDEGVEWIIFNERKSVCNNQINAIKNIQGKNGQILRSTYRPLQPLNGRSVSVF